MLPLNQIYYTQDVFILKYNMGGLLNAVIWRPNAHCVEMILDQHHIVLIHLHASFSLTQHRRMEG